MSDLSSLLEMAPNSAAFMMGQQNNSDLAQKQAEQARLAALVQQIQQQTQFSADQHPLDMDKLSLDNQYQSQVKIPTGLADLTAANNKNAFTTATQPGAISAANAGNANTVATDNETTIKTLQSKVARLATVVQGQPAPLRSQALMSALQAEGLNPQDPKIAAFMQDLNSRDPNTWPDRLNNIADTLGKQASLQSPAYRAQTEDAKTRGAAEVQSAGINADAHIKAAQIMADGRLAAAKAAHAAQNDIMIGVLSGKVSPGNAVVTFNLKAKQAEMQGDDENAKFYRDQATQMEKFVYNKNAAVGAGKPTIGPDGKLATTPAPTPVTATQPPATSGTVKVKNPDGVIGEIPAENLDKALQQGYTRIQ